MSAPATQRPTRPARGDRGTFVSGLNQALHHEMTHDPSLLVFGEDVAQLGGLFRVTEGLNDAFPGRVFDLPIAENGYTGVAVGAAMAGHNVVVEMQVIDFVLLAADAIANAGGLHFASGGQVNVPIVVRGPVGLGTGFGVTHSQRLEAALAARPGITVLMPSTPADAKGLLTSAIRSPNPVVIFEDAQLYYKRGELPADGTEVPIGKARTAREGGDVTLVSSGNGLATVLAAADELAGHGIEADVIDLRTLRPLDWPAIEASVRRTRRFAIVLDGPSFCSYGSYVAAEVARRCWEELAAAPQAIGGIDAPAAASQPAEAQVQVAGDDVVALVRSMVR